MNRIYRIAFALSLLWAAPALADRLEMQPQVVNTPSLTAKLVDPAKNSAQKSAVVEVTVTGVKLVDPSASSPTAQGEAHLHYQVDKGFIIATPAAKLAFHGLSSGAHSITVSLANNSHQNLGPQQTLNVQIP